MEGKNQNCKSQIKSACELSIPIGGVGSRRRGALGLLRSLREQARRNPPPPPPGLLLNPLSPLPPSTNNSTYGQGWIQIMHYQTKGTIQTSNKIKSYGYLKGYFKFKLQMLTYEEGIKI